MMFRVGLDGLALVRAEIVHDHDVAWPQAWDENFFHIEPEAFTIDRTVEEPNRFDLILAQCGQEGHGLPMAMRHLGLDPLAAWRPASQRSHVSFRPVSSMNTRRPGSIRL
jgi:hypothetical protein